MSGRSRSFRWTWIINVYSLFFLAFGAPGLLHILVDDIGYIVRMGDYLMIGSVVALAALWLFSRCRGGWRILEPPPGVSLFWVSLSLLGIAVSLFVR